VRDPLPSTQDLARRLNAHAHVSRVVTTRSLSSSLTEVELEGAAPSLTGQPGNDVMVLVDQHGTRMVRRRYSVRSVDLTADRFRLWVATGHDGAGSDWARRARSGDEVDVVGPRGSVLVDPHAAWHLFVGDVSGLGAFYRMAESLTAPCQALVVVEINHDDDALTTSLADGVAVTGVFVEGRDRRPDDPHGLLLALAALTMPTGDGHAYVVGEFSVLRTVVDALRDRGFDDRAISAKSYWRADRANADHGEPERDGH
jgi:NADPH-dependent ferric siderophore reductase